MGWFSDLLGFGDDSPQEESTTTITPKPVQLPDYPEATGARESWYSSLQDWKTQPGYGAIQPDWDSIWENARSKVQRYFYGGPEGPGAIAGVRANSARRGVGDMAQADSQIAKLNMQQGNNLSDIATAMAIEKARLGERGRETWLNSISQLAGLKPQFAMGSEIMKTVPGVGWAEGIGDILTSAASGPGNGGISGGVGTAGGGLQGIMSLFGGGGGGGNNLSFLSSFMGNGGGNGGSSPTNMNSSGIGNIMNMFGGGGQQSSTSDDPYHIDGSVAMEGEGTSFDIGSLMNLFQNRGGTSGGGGSMGGMGGGGYAGSLMNMFSSSGSGSGSGQQSQGFLGYGDGKKGWGGALNGGVQGASMGSSFGPYGTIIGGVLGALLGAFTK